MMQKSEGRPSERPPDQHPAVPPLQEAHDLLRELQAGLNRHPQLEQAILKVENALRILNTKTGGML